MEEDRLEVACREAQTLCRRILEDGLPEEAELTYSGRNQLYAVPLKCGVTANVKVFKRPGALRGIIYGIFARPKSLKSFVNARRLLSLGISTPEPLAHLEERIWGGLRLARSCYVCVHIKEAEEIRCWEDRADRDELVEALGREMARLTEAGVLFRDFSPGNVLLKQDRRTTPTHLDRSNLENGSMLSDASRHGYAFTFVDVNRTDFNVRSRRRMMTMFRRINIVPEETARLARAYARALGEDERAMETGALKTLRRFLWKKDILLATLKKLIRPFRRK